MKAHTTHTRGILDRGMRFLGVMLMLALIIPAAAISQLNPAQANSGSPGKSKILTLFNNPATVNLGSASKFAILSQAGISTTGVTSITGDIGVSSISATAITGFGLIMDATNTFSTSSLVTGNVYAADYTEPTPTEMTAAVGDMGIAYNDAMNRPTPDATELGAGDITTMTLTRGLYKWSSGVLISAAGVTLSGSATDVWIFQIAQDLVLASGATVNLTGGALASNIFWQVTGQVDVEAGATLQGNVLCATLIAMKSTGTLNGRALSQTSVTLIANTVTRPSLTTLHPNPTAVALVEAATFKILAGTAITISSGSTVPGNIGLSPGVGSNITGLGLSGVTGTIYTIDGNAPVADVQDPSLLNAAQGDLTTNYNTTAGLSPDATVGPQLGGTTLGRGIYASTSGSFGLTGSLILSGTSSDVFIFQTATGTGALTTAASSRVILVGGALASNVFWQIGSSATLGAGSGFAGTMMAEQAITMGAGVGVDGRALASAAAVSIGINTALPVELVSFTATANRMNAVLHWSTATETNNYGFEIERRQTGNWEKIGFVAGAGSSSSPRNYSYTDNNLSHGSYAYRIKQVNKDGSFSYRGSAEIEIASTPEAFALIQNYPNPFNPSTRIQYSLEKAGVVSLKVYNVLGLEVATLVNGHQEAGSYAVPFNATGLSSGVYFYRLEAGSLNSTKKLILMK